MEKRINRECNIEILRIVSMFLIVASHCFVHMKGNSQGVLYTSASFNHMVSLSLGIWGQLGTAIFIIITAWYQCDKEGIHLKRILTIIFQTWIYCIGITTLVYILRVLSISIQTVIREIITPLYDQYWFITTYIAFYMLLPVLQSLTKRLSQNNLRKIVIILTALIPMYNMIFRSLSGTLGDFIYLYILVVYLKRKRNNWIETHCSWIFLGCIFCVWGLAVGLNLLGLKTGNATFQVLISYVTGRNIVIYLAAISAFYLFRSVKISNNSLVETLSKATLGVYIIHENLLLRGTKGVDSLLWNRIFHVDLWYDNSRIYILYFLFAVIITYAICTIIEIIRAKVIDEFIIGRSKRVDELCKKFDNWYKVEDYN